MAITVQQLKTLVNTGKRYTINDDKGLQIEVMASGNKIWRFRYWIDKKEYKLTIGSYPEIGLSEARKKRDELRGDIARGINPAQAIKEKKAVSEGKYHFENVAKDYIEKFSSRWTKGHAELVYRRLELNVFPFLGKQAISTITAPELLEVLRKIEKRGALETAQRVRGICSSVFRYAIATGLAERDPAADLKGALTPPPKRHYASITEPKKVAKLLQDMEKCEASYVVYCALQITPHLFVRPGELRHAEWSEIDFEAKEWRIPAEKMKMKTTHIVPLSKQVFAMLKELHKYTGEGKYLFPAITSRLRPMSENTINVALRRIGYTKDDMTAHGFRSLASTLLNEQGWNRDAIERQLAHGERNKVRAAYNYAEFMPERRKMMQWWSDYLDELRSGVKTERRGRKRK